MRRTVVVVAAMALGLTLAAVFGADNVRHFLAQRDAFPGKWLANIDGNRWPEPSGIVYHPKRKTLFVVSDEGHVCEMQTDGKMVRQLRSSTWRDYEGITVNPATGLVYIAVEGEEKILEIDPKTLATKRTFAVERTFEGQTVMKAGSNGIEGITFVPDPKHPEGGTFIVAHQAMNRNTPGEVSALFEIEVPLVSGGEGDEPACKILRKIDLNTVDLSAVCYDGSRDCLYVLSDNTDTLLEVKRDGSIVHTWKFPGRDQEGLTFDDQDHVYVAQDSGGIIKYKWQRE
ncbi:MAG: SdiA-regulated domain-containing protein [Planctomycetes bacterium]|nr:SdiA-regulated domain-containing protein [Planctomycetota bacterium]